MGFKVYIDSNPFFIEDERTFWCFRMKAKVWSDAEKKWMDIERDCDNQYLNIDIFRCKITKGYCRNLMDIKAYCDKTPLAHPLTLKV